MRNQRDHPNEKPRSQDVPQLAEQQRATYDIVDGTEQIQQLVIARAITGMRIE